MADTAGLEMSAVTSTASSRKKPCEAERKGLSQQRRTAARLLWEKVILGSMIATKFISILTSRRQTYQQVDEKGRVFRHIKLMFAAPQFALIPLTLLINVFIIKFYLDDMGVSPAFVAFFQIFSRSFDVLTDPLMAHISDNLTKTRIGRRLPYMMLCPLYAVAFLILVSPPKGDPELAAWWFGGSYLFFYFCDTLINVPFQALGPELTDDTDERTSLYMWVKLAEGAGVMVGSLGPSILQSVPGLTNQSIYQGVAIVFGLFYIIAMYVLILNVKERPASLIDTNIKQPFVTSLYRAMRNSSFRPLCIGWVLDFASLAFVATMVPFYVTYYIEVDTMDSPFCSGEPSEKNNYCKLNSDQHLGFAMASLFVSGFVAIPFWRYLSRFDRKSDAWYERLKIGKVQAWLTYNVVNVVTNVLFVFVPQKGLWFLYFCMIMNGFPTGGQFLIASVLTDVIDYDEFLNYKRNEGQFTVFATFVPKLVAIPCQSFPLVGMYLLGYINPEEDANGDLIFQPQNPSIKWFIRCIFVFGPLLLTSISYLVKRRYPIKDLATVQAVSKGITLHLQGQPALDPVTGQYVWIEEHSDEEQYLIYLLDQFNHSNLLWLLSPTVIWARHKEQGMPLRKATLQHLEQIDDDDIQQMDMSNIDNDKQPEPRTNTSGCCSCFDTKIHIKNIIRTKNKMEFGRDDNGKIVFVAIADLEAHGVNEGVKRIKIRVLIWIILYFVLFLISVIGAVTTLSMELLKDKNWAFIPAIFCLMVGLTLVGVGFNVLRYRAAGEIKEYIQKHNISDEVLAKCIYPKTKGQRGGELVEDTQRMNNINEMIPKEIAHPKSLRSLTNLDVLVQPLNNDEDDLYH